MAAARRSYLLLFDNLHCSLASAQQMLVVLVLVVALEMASFVEPMESAFVESKVESK